ncbi:MAG: hypothetical protein SOI38_01075 [Eggerthellaceae bacterium]
MQQEAGGMTVAEARDAAIGIIEDCLAIYGDQAQAVSASFFDEICAAEGIDVDPGAMFDDIIDGSMLASKVHWFAGKLVGDWDGYVGSNADLAAYYVHRSALENMERNCDANHVRYARVPTGRETCSWCYMLASRDFDYRSEEDASAASHPHCDCVIVPGVKGRTHIEGYDPGGMRKRMDVIEKHTGLRFGDDRRQMDAITREMQGMSREWLFYGNGGPYDGLSLDAARLLVAENVKSATSRATSEYSASNLDVSLLNVRELRRMKKNKPLEWAGYVGLSTIGHGQVLQPEQSDASANIDTLMEVDGEWHYWDLKTIEGGTNAIKKRMTECYSKWTRLLAPDAIVPSWYDPSVLDQPRAIVDNRFSKISDEDAKNQIVQSMKYLSSRGELDFVETLLIKKDGSEYLIKNK